MTVPILSRLAELRVRVSDWRKAGQTIGVVPTMGALHAGHLSLVEAARRDCDRVVVTIFVNPKQFNNPEDLAKYPRTEDEDAARLAPLGVDAIYAPEPDQIYPPGFATTVSVTGLTDVMEGAYRPGHFDGVATVVAKLFLQTAADRAYFGQKDYQQFLVVRRMARDLDVPIEIIGCPTVREASGLAMSSRNRRLSPGALECAAHLHREMQSVAEALRGGADFDPDSTVAALEEAGFSGVDYFELRSSAALAPLGRLSEPARIFVAAWIEDVRLIDNVQVLPEAGAAPPA